jgi:hypothetical protein
MTTEKAGASVIAVSLPIARRPVHRFSRTSFAWQRHERHSLTKNTRALIQTWLPSSAFHSKIV